MTVVRDLRKGQEEVKTKKPIEFKKYWAMPVVKNIKIDCILPNYFKYIDCLCDWGEGQLMIAYDTNPSRGCLYWGYWNDGVVE